jgi:HEAT repeat protein
MVIVLNCPGCGKRFEVDGSLAGKKSRCKQCGAVFPIPTPGAKTVDPPIAAKDPAPPAKRAASSQWESIVDSGAREPRGRRAAAVGSPSGSQAARSAGSIVLNCPQCQRKYEFDSLLAGKNAKCKDCGLVFAIPVPRGRTSEAAPARDPGALAAAPATSYWEEALGDVPSSSSAAGAPGAFADDDEYFQALPRAAYPARKGKASSGRATDPSIGITVAGWYFALSMLLLIMMSIWFAVSTSGQAQVRGIFGFCIIGIQLLGAVVGVWGGIWLLVIAFKETIGQGLLTLFVPCYALYYTFSRWEQTKGAFALQLADFGSVILFAIIGAGVVEVSNAPGTDAGGTTTVQPTAPSGPGAGPWPGGGPPPRGGPGSPPARFGSVSMDPRSQYKRLVAQYGDKAVMVLYSGLPSNSDPTVGVTLRDVSEAANKRMRELAPVATNWMTLTIENDSGLVLAPIDDIRALAAKIDFGKATVLGNVISVELSRDYVASVPQLPAEPKVAVVEPGRRDPEPEIPADANLVTNSLVQLKSADTGRKKQAVQRLERTTPGDRRDEVVAALLPLLDHDDGFLVNDVVKTLAVWRSPSAVPALIARLSDNRFFVRKEAIKTLGKYIDARVCEPIAERLKEDGFEAEDALKQMGSIAEPTLIERLKHADPDIRRRACNILKEIGGLETLKAMQSLPSEPEFSVKVAANRAMKQINERVGPVPSTARSGKASATTPRPRTRTAP